MEEYYLEQEMLYYIFYKPTDTIHRMFVLSIPGPVVKMMEAKFKADMLSNMKRASHFL